MIETVDTDFDDVSFLFWGFLQLVLVLFVIEHPEEEPETHVRRERKREKKSIKRKDKETRGL